MKNKVKPVPALIRIPGELKKRIEIIAKDNGISFNRMVNRILDQSTKENEK